MNEGKLSSHRHSQLFKHSQSWNHAMNIDHSGLSKFPLSPHYLLIQVKKKKKKLSSIPQVDPIPLRPWTLSYLSNLISLEEVTRRPMCREHIAFSFPKSFYISKHLMPSFPILSSQQEAQGYRPCCSQGRKEHHKEATTNHNHIQCHSSQKTVYISSPHRTYFKVTKYFFYQLQCSFFPSEVYFLCPFMVHKYHRKVVFEIFTSSSSLIIIHFAVWFGLCPKGWQPQFSFSLHPRAFFPNLQTRRRPSTRSRISRLQ